MTRRSRAETREAERLALTCGRLYSKRQQPSVQPPAGTGRLRASIQVFAPNASLPRHRKGHLRQKSQTTHPKGTCGGEMRRDKPRRPCIAALTSLAPCVTRSLDNRLEKRRHDDRLY